MPIVAVFIVVLVIGACLAHGRRAKAAMPAPGTAAMRPGMAATPASNYGQYGPSYYNGYGSSGPPSLPSTCQYLPHVRLSGCMSDFLVRAASQQVRLVKLLHVPIYSTCGLRANLDTITLLLAQLFISFHAWALQVRQRTLARIRRTAALPPASRHPGVILPATRQDRGGVAAASCKALLLIGPACAAV